MRVPARDVLVGWLGRFAARRHPQTVVLGRAKRGDLLALLDRDPATACIVLQRDFGSVKPSSMLQAVTEDDLRSGCARGLSLHADAPAVARLLYESIGLSGAQLSREQLEAALIAVTNCAASLTSIQARAVLRRCLQFGSQPVQPYEPPGLSLLAKESAVAILEEHPELDSLAWSRTGPAAWSDLGVLGTALVRRPIGRSSAVGTLFEQWKPSTDEAVRFAATADTRRLTATPPIRRRSLCRRLDLGTRFRRLARLAGTPLALALVIASAWYWEWTDPPIRPEIGWALGAMAIVAGVHVVSAQLAAARLQGVLARFSTASTSLAIAYWSAVASGLLAIASPSSERTQDALAWGATVAAVVFLLAVVAAAHGLVRQTDPGVAVSNFVKNRRRAIRVSGYRLGRAQRAALDFRSRAARLAFVSLQPSLPVVARGLEVRAGRRGLHLPDVDRLEKLHNRPEWAELRLQLLLLGQVGTVVPEGALIARVVPDASSSVSATDLKRVYKSIRVRTAKSVEETAEAAVLLVDVAVRLAGRGDASGGERAVEALIAMLRIHLAAVHDAMWGSESADELAPVVPAVRAPIESALERLRTANGAEAELLLHLVDRLLNITGRAEAAVSMVVSRASHLEGRVTDWQLADLLRACALRALATDDHFSLALVYDETEERILDQERQPRGPILEFSSELAAVVCVHGYSNAMSAWLWWWKATQPLGTATVRHLGAARIAAAALEAGVLSVALAVSLELRSSGASPTQLQDLLTHEEVVTREKTLADLNGGYLGPAPAEALARVGDFLAATATHVGP